MFTELKLKRTQIGEKSDALRAMLYSFHHLPDRVIINNEGEADSPHFAAAKYDLRSDVIFVRKDGWMLGAPVQFIGTAYEMWKDEWEGFLVCIGSYPIDMVHKILEVGRDARCNEDLETH